MPGTNLGYYVSNIVIVIINREYYLLLVNRSYFFFSELSRVLVGRSVSQSNRIMT